MKAFFQYTLDLSSLKPQDVELYLQISGWSREQYIPDKISIWIKEQAEILLPLSIKFGDYFKRIEDILNILELVEKRSVSEIYNDMIMNNADIIRVRLINAKTNEGTIPLNEGIQLLKLAQNMMIASANSTIEKKPVYPTSKFKNASSYVETLKMGQTEKGSYVIKILSYLPKIIDRNLFGLEEPFERRVTKNLLKSLYYTKKAAIKAISNRFDMQDFFDGVPYGINANLCEAISSYDSPLLSKMNLQIHISWSNFRPIVETENDIVEFSNELMPILREAAREFRAQAPINEIVEIKGPVIILKRPRKNSNSEMGLVTIWCDINDQTKSVQLELNKTDLEYAIKAFKEQNFLKCEGILNTENRGLKLINPTNIKIEECS